MAGVIAVIFPDLLQVIADFVGVTRGVDLMLYALVLIIIYVIGSTSVRFREQEARLVRLTRELALAEAELHWTQQDPAGRSQSSRRTSRQ